MKTLYNVPLGRLQEVIIGLDMPELWAYRCLSWDYTLKRWPSRVTLAKSIRMQQQRASKSSDWKPVLQLTDGEGY